MGWMDNLTSNSATVSSVVYDEIPLMVSQSGKLVCIKVGRDMPTVGIVGVRGGGKSRMFHSLLDNVYHKRKQDGILVLNDQHNESVSYSMKGYMANDEGNRVNPPNDKWEKQLKVLGMHPCRLPVVHCYPAIGDGFDSAPDTISKIKISLRKESIFKNEQLFDKNLKGSARYLRAIKEHLLKARSLDEAYDLIKHYVDNPRSAEKLMMLVSNLFQEKIISFDNDVIDKAWFLDKNTGERITLPVLLALLPTRCIPVLMVEQLQSKPYYSTYLKVILEDLFNNQKKGFFNDKQINTWVFIDELDGLDGIGRVQNDDGMTTILQRFVTEGRPSRIATVWATQVYSTVRHRIRSNTRYLVSFRNNSSADVNAIAKDFCLTESQAEGIKSLSKDDYECLAMTSEYFILYDLQTGERTKYTGVLKGYSLPPLSLHKPPGFITPKYNSQYANLHLRENRFRLGNERTGKLFLNEVVVTPERSFKYEPLKSTKFVPGGVDLKLFAPKSRTVVEIGYDELKNYGWEVYSRIVPPYYRVYKGQRVTYGLKMKSKPAPPAFSVLSRLPKDVVVEMNVYEKVVRIRSPNIQGGFTAWKKIHDGN